MTTNAKQIKAEENTVTSKFNELMLLFSFNFKTIFKSKRVFLFLIIFDIFALTLPIIFIPYWASGAMFNLIAIVMPLFVILGWTGYNTRRSTIFRNINLSGTSKNTFYFGQIITTVVVANIIAMIFWLMVALVGTQDIFLSDWIWTGKPRVGINPFKYLSLFNIVYATNVTALVVFAIYFLLNSITNDIKTYFILIMSILVISVIFGGSINSYFITAPDNSYIDIPWGFVNPDGSVAYYEDTFTGDIYMSQEMWEECGGVIFVETENEVIISGGLFPREIFFPTLFDPLYGVGEFSTTAITKHQMQEHFFKLGGTIYVVSDMSDYTNTILYSTPRFINDVIQPWDWFMINFGKNTWQWTAVLFQPYITVIAYYLIGSTISKAKAK